MIIERVNIVLFHALFVEINMSLFSYADKFLSTLLYIYEFGYVAWIRNEVAADFAVSLESFKMAIMK